MILSAPVLAPESTLTWSTGSQAPEITVAAAGEYALTITNLCGSVTDLVSIAIDPNQIALPSVTSFVLCEGESVVADVSQAFAADYLWSDGSTGPALSIHTPGVYDVTITTDCEMAEVDIVVEERDCVSDEVFVPNAFSPNHDHINDVLSVEFDHTNLTGFGIWIYDRWGEIVFRSEDPNFEWNGSYHSKALLPGVYVYQILIEREGERPLRLKGDVTLVR